MTEIATTGPARAGRRDWLLPLAICLTVAIALRAVLWDTLSYHHPDEIFQYLGQAHRLVTGVGIDTWEQHEGIRGRLIPQMLTLPMWLGALLSGDGMAAYLAMRLFGAAVALLIVPAAFAMGAVEDRRTAVALALGMATWPYIADLSSHVLSESIGGAVALCGGAAAMHAGQDVRRWALAGFLLGLAVLLRVQFAIFIGMFVLATARLDRQAWTGLIAGGAASLAIGALSDIAAGAPPFAWVVKTYWFNIVENRSAAFGIDGPNYYLVRFIRIFGIAIPFLLLGLRWLPRRWWPLALAVVADMTLLTVIGHKEARFAYLSVAAFLLLAMVATMKAVDELTALTPRTRLIGFAIAWIGALVLASAIWPAPRGKDRWSRLADTASIDPGTCGIGSSIDSWAVINLAALRRDVPVYADVRTAEAQADVAPRVNAWIADDPATVPAGFARARCLKEGGKDLCLYRRKGSCRAGPPSPSAMQAVVDRRQAAQFVNLPE